MTENDKAKIAVLGAGSWGSTIAGMLAGKGLEIRLWCHREDELQSLMTKRHPPGVPELKLPPMHGTTDLADALDGVEAAVLVIPAQATAGLCRELKRLDRVPKLLIIASKGIDLKTLRPLSDVVEEALPEAKVGVMSGPCIAREVAQGIPTSVVAACADKSYAEKIQRWFASPTFRVYSQGDVLGVEYGGAIKNVIAIAAGVGDGLGFGDNSKSALITRGLLEMRRFAKIMGADDLTISGLAGMGDLCVTCFSPYSRNRRFGEAMGKGKSRKEAIAEIGETVEGVPTAEAVVKIAGEKNFDVPIAEAVTKIVSGEWKPREAVGELMTRELKQEF